MEQGFAKCSPQILGILRHLQKIIILPRYYLSFFSILLSLTNDGIFQILHGVRPCNRVNTEAPKRTQLSSASQTLKHFAKMYYRVTLTADFLLFWEMQLFFIKMLFMIIDLL